MQLVPNLLKIDVRFVEVGRVWLELPSSIHSSKPNTSSIRKPSTSRIVTPCNSRPMTYIHTYIYIYIYRASCEN